MYRKNKYYVYDYQISWESQIGKSPSCRHKKTCHRTKHADNERPGRFSFWVVPCLDEGWYPGK